MVVGLMHIHQLDTFYKSYGSRNSPGVIWGHRGQKSFFYQKCCFSFRLHGMVMGLMHIHQLDTITNVMGLEIHTGSFGVTGSKSHFSPKMLFLLQFTWHNNETQAYSSTCHSLQKNKGLKIYPGSFGVTGVK